MKKMIVAAMVAVCFAATPVLAQDNGGVKMKDGKVWTKKDGKKTEVTTDMTLSDGSVVKPSGQVVMKDGTTKMLKDGESVAMDGTWSGNKMDRKLDKKNNDGRKDSDNTDNTNNSNNNDMKK